ncbi:MAG: bifunctional riboflavin kinase/FAD synthetase [Bacteroidota bacterium]
MNVFRDLNSLVTFRNAVITIGSFDGVHGGHQTILKRVKELAQQVNGESVVITFHPHPRLVVYPKDTSLRLINTIEEKIMLLERYGIDNVVVVPFTINFSQQSADEYIEKFLLEKFNPKYIVIGYDHRFGLNRQGDINYLKHYSKTANFEVDEIAPQQIDEITVSSTKVRTAIQAGDVKQAAKLLRHYFILSGTVVKGQQIGQTIGFPTANLKPGSSHKLLPKEGIYAVFVHHQNRRYQGMLYIGSRPTLPEHDNKTIEVNIFDFNKKIYGDNLTLELVDFIREDAKFNSLEELQTALANDKESTLKILKQQPLPAINRATFRYPEVAVVILNFNGEKYLADFLPSVLASNYDNFRVIVADNGSTDNSLAFLEKNYQGQVEILDLKHNYGFAGGYNQALRQVSSPYYVLLNSDVEVTTDWMRPIIELMEQDSTIGACQPKVIAHHDKQQFEHAGAAGGWMDNWGYPFCRGRLFDYCEKDEGQYDQNQEIFWATGAAMFVRGELYHEMGGLDASYFAHMEEIDLCWRIKRAGYKIMAVPESTVYHVGGGTLNYQSPRKTYLNFRNSLTTLLKNEKRRRLFWLLPWRMILDGVAGVKFLLSGQLAHIWQILRAHGYLYANFGTTMNQRRLFSQLVKEKSIGPPNTKGRLRKNILVGYYLFKKKTFGRIVG